MAHREGKWLALQQGPCGRLATEVPITSPVLDRLTRSKPLPISFVALQKQVPAARDVVFSPDGKVAVVLTVDSVQVRKLQAGRLSEPLVSIDLKLYHLETNLAMAEWALGTHVADWDRQMRSLPKLEPSKMDEQ